jgi:hypothetical protein
MTLGDAIFQKLTANSALQALVGKRIYPVTSPDKPETPYIIFNLIAGQPATTHSEPAELVFHLVQFSCWSETYEGAATLRDLLIAALDNQTLPSGEIADLDEAGRDDFDQAAQLYRCDADFTIPHR